MRSRIVIMMAGLMALGFITAVLGNEDTNFQELMTAGKTAAQKGDFDNALSNFNSALLSASKPELKEEAAYACNEFLRQNKKWEEAKIILSDFAADKSLPPMVRRKALTTLAYQSKWGSADEAKQYLDEAIALPTDNTSSTDVNQQVLTSIELGYVYTILKQPENALAAWIPIMERKEEVHPAHRSLAGLQIGLIYLKKKDLDNARKYFQMAVDYGKKVQYKYDFSEAQKELDKLNGKK